MTVAPETGWEGDQEGLRATQQSGLAAIISHCQLHLVVGSEPAPAILRAVRDLSADLVALVDIGHGWMHKLLIDSVIEKVLRETTVPVLLLSAPSGLLEE